MKSAIFNEVPLVLLASKLTGRPVKWMSTRSEAFLSDAQARDNVTEAELALDKDGNFLGLRVKTDRQHRRASADRHAELHSTISTRWPASIASPAIHVDVTAVFTHTNPVRPYRGNGRPEAAYVIERLVDLAADEFGIDPVELRRRNFIPPTPCRTRPALTFTYDCGEFEKDMDMALRSCRRRRLRQAPAESRKHGKLRGFGLSYSIERAGTHRLRRRGDAVRSLRRGDAVLRQRHARTGPRDRVQADRLRPPRPPSRRHRTTSRATPTRCSSAKAPAARARRPSAARPSTSLEEDHRRRRKRLAAHLLEGRRRRREFCRRHLLQSRRPTAR